MAENQGQNDLDQGQNDHHQGQNDQDQRQNVNNPEHDIVDHIQRSNDEHLHDNQRDAHQNEIPYVTSMADFFDQNLFPIPDNTELSYDLDFKILFATSVDELEQKHLEAAEHKELVQQLANMTQPEQCSRIRRRGDEFDELRLNQIKILQESFNFETLKEHVSNSHDLPAFIGACSRFLNIAAQDPDLEWYYLNSAAYNTKDNKNSKVYNLVWQSLGQTLETICAVIDNVNIIIPFVNLMKQSMYFQPHLFYGHDNILAVMVKKNMMILYHFYALLQVFTTRDKPEILEILNKELRGLYKKYIKASKINKKKGKKTREKINDSAQKAFNALSWPKDWDPPLKMIKFHSAHQFCYFAMRTYFAPRRLDYCKSTAFIHPENDANYKQLQLIHTMTFSKWGLDLLMKRPEVKAEYEKTPSCFRFKYNWTVIRKYSAGITTWYGKEKGLAHFKYLINKFQQKVESYNPVFSWLKREIYITQQIYISYTGENRFIRERYPIEVDGELTEETKDKLEEAYKAEYETLIDLCKRFTPDKISKKTLQESINEDDINSSEKRKQKRLIKQIIDPVYEYHLLSDHDFGSSNEEEDNEEKEADGIRPSKSRDDHKQNAASYS